tara:strand:+ start:1073 stop:1312 length:240 start_codon:yes stop_codon:yes gene_type:complete
MSDNIRQVEGYEHLVKDMNSKAVINTDKSAYERAKKRAQAAEMQRDAIRQTTREINNLKCEMHEIKSLLKELVGNNNGD